MEDKKKAKVDQFDEDLSENVDDENLDEKELK
jgi:hypothetical protein